MDAECILTNDINKSTALLARKGKVRVFANKVASLFLLYNDTIKYYLINIITNSNKNDVKKIGYLNDEEIRIFRLLVNFSSHDYIYKLTMAETDNMYSKMCGNTYMPQRLFKKLNRKPENNNKFNTFIKSGPETIESDEVLNNKFTANKYKIFLDSLFEYNLFGSHCILEEGLGYSVSNGRIFVSPETASLYNHIPVIKGEIGQKMIIIKYSTNNIPQNHNILNNMPLNYNISGRSNRGQNNTTSTSTINSYPIDNRASNNKSKKKFVNKMKSLFSWSKKNKVSKTSKISP
jgi:hypothetical protein